MLKIFTIGCPACNVLIKKVIAKGIPFALITDPAAFDQLNIDIFPMAQVDNGPLMSYGETLAWLKNQED